MKDFTFDEIQNALDIVTYGSFDKDLNFISAGFDFEKEIVVTLVSLPLLRADAPKMVNIVSEGESFQIPVVYVEGTELEDAIGDIELHPPFEIEDKKVAMGGDLCKNMKNPNFYGTTTAFFNNITIKAEGLCDYTYKQKDVMVSNNHVIGRSDKAKKANKEAIYTAANTKTAIFDHLVKFSCKANVDIAVAKIESFENVTKLAVRDIGKINNLRRPGSREAIRKFGARTGYSEGRVTKHCNIRNGTYIYRGVFETSGGFGCPGDSGSPVIGKDLDLVGIFSWVEHDDCSRKPKGYFFTLIKPGTLASGGIDQSSYEILVD